MGQVMLGIGQCH